MGNLLAGADFQGRVDGFGAAAHIVAQVARPGDGPTRSRLALEWIEKVGLKGFEDRAPDRDADSGAGTLTRNRWPSGETSY